MERGRERETDRPTDTKRSGDRKQKCADCKFDLDRMHCFRCRYLPPLLLPLPLDSIPYLYLLLPDPIKLGPTERRPDRREFVAALLVVVFVALPPLIEALHENCVG